MAEWYDREPHEVCRSFELENGNYLEIRRVLSNGFWEIGYRRGPSPNAFRGQYTSFNAAYDAAMNYFNRMVKPHRIIREVTEVAP